MVLCHCEVVEDCFCRKVNEKEDFCENIWKLVPNLVPLHQIGRINMDYLEYKGYKGSVEYSKEDNCLLGKVQGMSKDLITYEGQTLDELRKDFEDGVDSYLEGCLADGIEPAKPYSGKLNLRMSSELHSRVAAFVASTGITINDFINRAIKNELKKVAVL